MRSPKKNRKNNIGKSASTFEGLRSRIQGAPIGSRGTQALERKSKRINPLWYAFGAVVLLAVVAFLAINGTNARETSSGREPNEVVAGVVESPASPAEVVQPTATNTAEPIATEAALVEIQRVDVQQWWEAFVDEAEKDNCTPTYQLVNVRETGIVNAIPWTVDQNGETVQGIIPILCGTGAQLIFREIGVTVSVERAEELKAKLEVAYPLTVGPTHVMTDFRGFTFSNELLGGLSESGMGKLQQFEACAEFPGPYTALIVEGRPSLVELLTNGHFTLVGAASVAVWEQCLP